MGTPIEKALERISDETERLLRAVSFERSYDPGALDPTSMQGRLLAAEAKIEALVLALGDGVTDPRVVLEYQAAAIRRAVETIHARHKERMGQAVLY